MQDMTPNEINSRLVRLGKTQAEIARNCNVSRAMVSRVISGQTVSTRVMQAVAAAINLDVRFVWPSKFFEAEPRLGPTR